MNWFKHDSDARRSEKLSEIIENEGLEWYARWFIILEAIAEKMDKSDLCWLSLPVSEWCRLLKVKPQKLLRFCASYQNLLGIHAELTGQILKITVPNLLKKKNEYAEKSRQESGVCPPQRQSKEIRVSTKVDTKEKEEEKTGFAANPSEERIAEAEAFFEEQIPAPAAFEETHEPANEDFKFRARPRGQGIISTKQFINNETPQKAKRNVGPMRHLFDKIFNWCYIPDPDKIQDKELYKLAAALSEPCMERLIDDFIDRGYNPSQNSEERFSAFRAAGWDEYHKSKPQAEVLDWNSLGNGRVT